MMPPNTTLTVTRQQRSQQAPLLREVLGVGLGHGDGALNSFLALTPAQCPPPALLRSVTGPVYVQGSSMPSLTFLRQDAVTMSSEAWRLQLEAEGRRALIAAHESAVLHRAAVGPQAGLLLYGSVLSAPADVALPPCHTSPVMLFPHHGSFFGSQTTIQGLEIQAIMSARFRALLLGDGDRTYSEGHQGLRDIQKPGETKRSGEGVALEDLDESKGGTVPSERTHLNLPEKCGTAADSLKVLAALGTTLRSKSDPFIDASKIEMDTQSTPVVIRRGVIEIFPVKLYKMLQEVEEKGTTDVVSFMSHGRAFRVHKVDVFVKEIMPEYFSSLGKWSSFSRQCNLWGFLRCTDSENPDYSAYYHELFLRGQSSKLCFMRRVGIPHGKDRRKFRLPEGNDPNFYAMEPMPDFEDRGTSVV